MPSRNGQRGTYVSPYHVSVSYGAGANANTGADWFGPLTPMQPIAPPQTASRQWDYPSGFNLNTTARVYEPITFATLRGLADGYDLLRLLIETRKDQIARLGWLIKPRDVAGADEKNPSIKAVTAFLKRPDGFHSWDDWLRLVLEDLFVIDAPALYMQRDRAGNLLAMLPLDGATIKPVIDDWGRTPQPYKESGALVYPVAYQQIIKGYPAVDYSVRDLIYRPRNLRVNRAYGFGPVEQLVTTVNIALRKQLFTLEYYTSGNIPDSLIGVPDTWTPDQIASYQKYWDAYIEGDLGRRRKAKFVPGGMSKTFIQTKEPELKSDFDEWLARICCFAFSISPQAFVKQMNRASAETQKDLSEEEGLAPILKWIKSLMDDVIEREFCAPELEFAWGQDRLIDPMQQETMLSGYVKSGILTLNEARRELGREPCLDPAADRPMALTATGYVPVGAGAGSSPIENGGPSKTVEGACALAPHGEEPRSGVSNHEAVERTRSVAQFSRSSDGVEKFSPDQPRVPAGNGRPSGQWTSGDSGSGASAAAAESNDSASGPRLITGRSAAIDPAPSDAATRDGAPKLTPAQFLPPILAEPPILPPVEDVTPILPEPMTGPLPEVPKDPTVPPSPDFEWKGKGAPGSKEGSWYNPKTQESLRPDFDHPPPIPPHWDWHRPGPVKYRWYFDGSLERAN